jgi:hypothetical protein
MSKNDSIDTSSTSGIQKDSTPIVKPGFKTNHIPIQRVQSSGYAYDKDPTTLSKIQGYSESTAGTSQPVTTNTTSTDNDKKLQTPVKLNLGAASFVPKNKPASSTTTSTQLGTGTNYIYTKSSTYDPINKVVNPERGITSSTYQPPSTTSTSSTYTSKPYNNYYQSSNNYGSTTYNTSYNSYPATSTQSTLNSSTIPQVTPPTKLNLNANTYVSATAKISKYYKYPYT